MKLASSVGAVLTGALFAVSSIGCSGDTKAGSENAVCAVGQYKCNGDTLQVCNASRTGWGDLMTCPPNTCVEAQGRCSGEDGGVGGSGGTGGAGGFGGTGGTASGGTGGTSSGGTGGGSGSAGASGAAGFGPDDACRWSVDSKLDFNDPNLEGPQDVAVSADGYTYIGGAFETGLDFGGSYTKGVAEDHLDAFVLKMDRMVAAQPTWLRTIGGAGLQKVEAVASGPQGNTVVVGVAMRTSFSAVEADFGDFGGPVLSVDPPAWRGWLMLLNDQDDLVWQPKLLASGAVSPASAAIDSVGDILIVGSAESAADFGCGTGSTTGHMFLVKLSGADGACLWDQRFGSGDPAPEAMSLAVGPDDMPVIGGYFREDFAVLGSQLSSKGIQDGFVIRFDADGQTVGPVVTFGYPNDQQIVLAVAVDSKGRILAGGMFSREVDLGAAQNEPAPVPGSSNAFIVRIDETGAKGPYRVFGHANLAEAQALQIGPNDDVLVVGGLVGDSDFGNGTVSRTAPGLNAFVAVFEQSQSALDLAWVNTAKSAGGGQTVNAGRTYIDGDAVVVGLYQGDLTFGCANLTDSGGYDLGFAARVGPK